MSNQRKIKHMTSEELKAKLFNHFQRNGSFENLKSQLRGQLISELIKMSEPVKNDAFPPASDVEKCLLPLQVCNWLVYDHLSRQDYQYSLSVFVMEARVPGPDKFLTAGDILGLMGLRRNNADVLNISKLYSEKNELGFLHSLLLAVIKGIFNVPGNLPSSSSNLHDSKVVGVTEESNASQEKDRIESGLKTNSKRCSLEKSFCSDVREKSTEVSFQEQLDSVREESEKEVQKLRQRLLQEVKMFHDRERELKLEVESEKNELKREKAKLQKELESLRDKESSLEKEIQNRYEQKMRGIEADIASKLHWKDKELEAFKEKFNEKEQELSQVKTILSTERNSQNILRRELDELKYKYKAMQEQNIDLMKKFENMADYAVLKEEVASKSREILRLQMEIKNIHNQSETERRKYVETVRSLEDSLNSKEPELLQTQQELDSMQSSLNKKESIWNKEKKKLEQELNKFKELQRTLMQKVEDQEEDIKDLHQTIQTLNYKFINSSLTSKGNECSNYKTYPESERNITDPIFVKRSVNYPSGHSGITNNRSLQFLSDAKSRLGKLEEEEVRVQEKCSFIFSSFPVGQKEYINGSGKLHKNALAGSKSLFPVSKSGFDFDDWYESKMASRRSKYSLDDIKQLVSQSVLSNKPTLVSDFHRNTRLLEASKSTSKVNEWFKISGDQPFIDLENQHRPAPNNDTANSSVPAYDKSVAKVVDDASIVETSLFQHFTDKHGSLAVTDDCSNVKPSEETSIKNNFEKNAETQNQTKPTSLGTTELVSSQLAENAQDLEISKSTGTTEKTSSVRKASNPISVNLDEAWKRRVSNPAVLPPLGSSNEAETSKPQGLLLFNPFSISSRTTFPKPLNRTDAQGSDSTSVTISNNPDAQNIGDNPIKNSVVNYVVNETENSCKNLEFRNKVSSTTNEKSLSCSQDEETTVLNTPKGSHNLESQKIDDPIPHAKELNKNISESTASMDHQSSSNSNKQGMTSGEVPDKSDNSASELSEIHLSCGSEGEQQKDDSDAW